MTAAAPVIARWVVRADGDSWRVEKNGRRRAVFAACDDAIEDACNRAFDHCAGRPQRVGLVEVETTPHELHCYLSADLAGGFRPDAAFEIAPPTSRPPGRRSHRAHAPEGAGAPP